MQRKLRRFVPALTAVAIGMAATLPARAALVGTDQAAPSAVQSERERVKALVARPEVAVDRAHIEQCGIRGHVTGGPEVVHGRNDAAAPEPCPDAVGHHAGRQRVNTRRDPLGQLQPPAVLHLAGHGGALCRAGNG